jgi:esterase/lipase superfamily enzyme
MRYLVVLGLIVLGAVIAVSLYQPPMRLMPAPAKHLGAESSAFAADPSAPEARIAVFYATNRLPIGAHADRLYAVIPGQDLHVGVATIRIGEEGTTWDRIYAWSTRASDDPRPFLNLVNLNEHATIESGGPLPPQARAWFGQINDAIERSHDKDVIVYVHGANTNVERAAGQAAQLHHFTGRNSVVVLFAWPTAENFLLYSRDMVTAFGAAPHLAQLIELLAQNTDAVNIDVLTYSAGATVGSNGLAMAGRDAKQGATAPRLGEIYHAAPDADFRSFVDDMGDYANQARRVTVAVNLGDSALRLSQVINRASRAGRPDMRELSSEATRWLLDATRQRNLDVLRVRPENIPGLSNSSHTFWYEDPWVSSDVLIKLLYHLPADERGLAPGKSPTGTRYWTFMPDYPERLSKVMTRLRQEGQAWSTSAPTSSAEPEN